MHNFVIIGATPRLPPKGGMTGPTLAQNLATERHIEERGVVLMRRGSAGTAKMRIPAPLRPEAECQFDAPTPVAVKGKRPRRQDDR
jgi:hypothetical protein